MEEGINQKAGAARLRKEEALRDSGGSDVVVGSLCKTREHGWIWIPRKMVAAVGWIPKI